MCAGRVRGEGGEGGGGGSESYFHAYALRTDVRQPVVSRYSTAGRVPLLRADGKIDRYLDRRIGA